MLEFYLKTNYMISIDDLEPTQNYEVCQIQYISTQLHAKYQLFAS